MNPQTYQKYVPLGQFLLIFGILMRELVFPDTLALSWQIIALLGMIIVLPYVPLIQRISYGDWEAELGSEIIETEERVEEGMPIPENVEISRHVPEGVIEKIYKVNEESHIAALGLLRTELEVALREFYDQENSVNNPVNQPMSLGQLTNLLKKDNSIDKSTLAAIDDVRHLANKAIHEKNVPREEADKILDIGVDALQRLYYIKSSLDVENSQMTEQH